MNDFNIFALIVATVGAFVLSGIWYTVFSGVLAKLNKAYANDKKMTAIDIVLELLRCFVVVLAITYLVNKTGISSLRSAFSCTFVVWMAFPCVLLAGSVLHEKVPSKLAAIHAGDWLIKLLFITILITLWK